MFTRPVCPQIRNGRLETRLYGLPREIIPEKEVLEENEFECLNLTITAPAPSCRSQHELLPVMVWIHGGGNVTGCGTDWIWDAGALVRRSVQINKPVIIVAVKYVLMLSHHLLILDILFGDYFISSVDYDIFLPHSTTPVTLALHSLVHGSYALLLLPSPRVTQHTSVHTPTSHHSSLFSLDRKSVV